MEKLLALQQSILIKSKIMAGRKFKIFESYNYDLLKQNGEGEL
jgi:hypothetical protein